MVRRDPRAAGDHRLDLDRVELLAHVDPLARPQVTQPIAPRAVQQAGIAKRLRPSVRHRSHQQFIVVHQPRFDRWPALGAVHRAPAATSSTPSGSAHLPAHPNRVRSGSRSESIRGPRCGVHPADPRAGQPPRRDRTMSRRRPSGSSWRRKPQIESPRLADCRASPNTCRALGPSSGRSPRAQPGSPAGRRPLLHPATAYAPTLVANTNSGNVIHATPGRRSTLCTNQ